MSDTFRYLPSELAEKAQKELGEKTDEVKLRIQDLREALLQDSRLNSRTDDAFLLRFLRARKFNKDRAFQLIKNYYKQRIKYPHLFKNLSASSIPNVLESNVMGMLSKKDQEGKYIFVYNSSELWDPEKVPLEDGIRYCLLTLERAVVEEDFQVLGVVSIADCKGFGMNHLRCFTPSKLTQFFSVTQNGFPARFKEFHFVNEPPVFDLFYALIKPFISKKLKSRLFFHGNSLSSLHQYFSPDILPSEFGGRLGPFNTQEWNNKLIEHDCVILKNTVYGYDKSSANPA